VPPIQPLPAFTQKIITVPDAAQLYVYLGHAGILRLTPDYYKLLVMDYVLGTGPGFTDRAVVTLRESAGIGLFRSSDDYRHGRRTWLGPLPAPLGPIRQFQPVKDGFLKEIRRIRDEAPTAEEVEDAKTYLLGSQPFHYTSNNAIAEQLLQIERFGLGFDYQDAFRKAVSAVTLGRRSMPSLQAPPAGSPGPGGGGPVTADGNPLPKK